MNENALAKEPERAREAKEQLLAEDSLVDTSNTTSRNELWSYYLYYIGNNGLSGFNFGPSQFQNLLFLAGHDPTSVSEPCGSNGCVLPYLGKTRDSELIVTFAIYNETALTGRHIPF